MKKLILIVGLMSIAATAFGEFLPPSFSSRFEQEYISTLKGKLKKGQGTIDYKYPGQIRFETNTPSTVVFVSNGAKAWYYRAPFIEGEQGEVTETSASEGASVYIKFFDALKKGLSNNDYYDVKDNLLLFKSKAKSELGIIKAKLVFKGKAANFENLEIIDLTFTDGKNSKIKFIDLKTNVAFSADKFNFVAPANTKKTN